jgi:hypothetical protein
VLRRALPLLALLVLLVSGCGSKSSGSGLDTALSYMPKDAPAVFAIDTDLEGSQWQQVDKLIGKFPFGGQVKTQLKSALSGRAGIDYDKDVKPLLGNDFVAAVTSASDASTPFVIAWKVGDEDAARKLIEKDAQKAQPIEGADVYRTQGGDLVALDDGVLVSASTPADLTAALKRAGSGDGLTEETFNEDLGDLEEDSLMRVTGDVGALYKDPSAGAARKVKFVAAQTSYGITLRAEDDGIEIAFDNRTEGDLADEDLPLAPGAEAAPVVRRAGEIGIGLRDPAHLIQYFEKNIAIASPSTIAGYNKEKAKAAKQLGIDIDKDLIGQLTGNSALSISLTGDFAVRADLADPPAAEATLKKVAPQLVKIAKKNGKSLGLSTPKNGKGFYALAQANGKKVVFGVVGKTFVAATDAARAAQFAGQSPSAVPGAKGAFVIASDARALANAIAEQRGQGQAAQLVTGALGDLIGSVENDEHGSRGSIKLFVK